MAPDWLNTTHSFPIIGTVGGGSPGTGQGIGGTRDTGTSVGGITDQTGNFSNDICSTLVQSGSISSARLEMCRACEQSLNIVGVPVSRMSATQVASVQSCMTANAAAAGTESVGIDMSTTATPKMTVGTKPCLCNSGIPRTMSPQAIGDAAQTMNPGPITGQVPAFLVIPRVRKPVGQNLTMLPQSVPQYSGNQIRVVPNYPPGVFSNTVPIDPRTQLRYYGVV